MKVLLARERDCLRSNSFLPEPDQARRDSIEIGNPYTGTSTERDISAANLVSEECVRFTSGIRTGRLGPPQVEEAFNTLSRAHGGRTLKSAFSVSLVLRRKEDMITLLGNCCMRGGAWEYGETAPRLLIDDKIPLANRMAMITADLLENGYVDDAGFYSIRCRFSGCSSAPPLDSERAPTGTDDDYMGSQIVPEEYPPGDPVDTDVGDNNAESDAGGAFCNERRAPEVGAGWGGPRNDTFS